MMPYIIMLKVRKFHQSTRNRFGTAGKKPVGGGGGGTQCGPPSLNRVKSNQSDGKHPWCGIIGEQSTSFIIVDQAGV